VKWLTPNLYTRAVIFFIGDFIISLFTFISAYMLRFNFDLPNWVFNNFYFVFFSLFFLKVFYLAIFKQYLVSWRFYSIYDLKKLFIALSLAYFTFFIFYYLFKSKIGAVPRSAILIDYFLSLLFIAFFRISRRAFTSSEIEGENVILIGANENANHLIKSKKFNVIDIYDDEGIGSYIQGLKIKPIEKITKNVESVVITKELSREKLDKLFDFLQEKKFKDIKIYNPFEKKVEDISIEDLLARKPKDLDKEAIKKFVKNKKILITGAGGSIGSEICRLCERYGARELVLVDNCEFNLYAINEELEVKREPYLIDVAKKDELQNVFEKEKPEIVIHAAAYKHVPMCEYNPRSAVINNILGTINTIDLTIEFDVKDFILISTDKAVRPTNIMGATKRVCEIYAQNVDSNSTKICAVRFGNVLGSSGSVVPKFKKLINRNKPLPVTHPEITRYFMLIPEACELVLQAGSLAKKKEIFILDMGEPVKIVDLAKKMLRLYGKDENNIKFTGLRPGEKLYEELLINEADKKTKYQDIFIATPTKYNFELLKNQLNKLFKTEKKEDIITLLTQIIPEFNHKN